MKGIPDPDMFSTKNTHIHRGTVHRLDASSCLLTLDDRSIVQYEKLLVASGYSSMSVSERFVDKQHVKVEVHDGSLSVYHNYIFVSSRNGCRTLFFHFIYRLGHINIRGEESSFRSCYGW